MLTQSVLPRGWWLGDEWATMMGVRLDVWLGLEKARTKGDWSGRMLDVDSVVQWSAVPLAGGVVLPSATRLDWQSGLLTAWWLEHELAV